jgi:amino acid transporter
MTETRRRVVLSGLLVAFLTLASGLISLLVTSRILWALVFAAVCYPAFRVTHQESPAFPAAPRKSTPRGPEPWRAELAAGVVSVLACLLLAPFVAGGLTAYLVAAVVVLIVYLLTAWWFG